LFDVLDTVVVLVNCEARSSQDEVTLLVIVPPLQRFKAVVFDVSALVAQHVQLGASHVKFVFNNFVATLLINALLETVQRFLEVLLFVLRFVEEKSAELLVSVRVEILSNIGWRALEGKRLQGFELGSLKHLWRDVRAIQRMVHPFFQRGFSFLLGLLGHGGCKLIEVNVVVAVVHVVHAISNILGLVSLGFHLNHASSFN